MRLLVCGSRDLNKEQHKKLLFQTLELFLDRKPTIISGAAQGPDTFALEFADLHNLEKRVFIPDWSKHGRAAGFVRNREMVKVSDFVVALWDNKSSGTRHTIQEARDRNLPRLIVLPNGQVIDETQTS